VIALPGLPGESADWLNVLTRDGVDAVRSGINAATQYVPTAAELQERDRRVKDAGVPPAVCETPD